VICLLNLTDWQVIQERDALQESTSEVERRLMELLSSVQGLELALSEKDNEIAILKERCQRDKDKSERDLVRYKALAKDMESLGREAEKQRGRADSMMNEYEEMRSQTLTQRERFKMVEAQCAELKDRIQSSEAQCVQLQERLKMTESRCMDLKERLQLAEGECVDLRATRRELTDKVRANTHTHTLRKYI
jgi:predicted nuclease with TOPRIM domain